MSLSAAAIKEAVTRNLKSLYGWTLFEHTLTIERLNRTREGEYEVEGVFNTSRGSFSFNMRLDSKGEIVQASRKPQD